MPLAALTVAASWNGATEVASWQVLAGASPTSLAPVASAPKSGFQTPIAIGSAPAYLAVQALERLRRGDRPLGNDQGLSPTAHGRAVYVYAFRSVLEPNAGRWDGHRSGYARVRALETDPLRVF